MIRPATPDDVPLIRDLLRSEDGFWQDAWRPDVLAVALDSAAGLAFVWAEGERVLGFVCAHDLGFRAYLSELIVSPDARSRGIGRRLVEHVEDALRRRGCAVLLADVWRDAEAFYRSLGWSEPDVTLLRKTLIP